MKPRNASRWGAKDPERAAYIDQHLPASRQAGQAGLFGKYP